MTSSPPTAEDRPHGKDRRAARDRPPGGALLRAEGLSKRYGDVVALDDLSFVVSEGITGLLGENGAGKSTAIRIFLGLTRPTSGSATVLGEDVSASVAVRARVGYMPEHECLPDDVTAAEFLTHMAQVSGLPPAAARVRAADTLRHTGLFEERYREMEGYSTGMKQRVKLAQALVHDPDFVFLDEPTSGLDPVGREEMLTLVRRTHREFGISVLVSSHLMADVERTCDRILVLRDGRLVQSGEVGRFTEETESLFVEVDARRDRLADALETRGVEVTAEAGGLTLEGADGSIHDHVRDALVETGAPLRRMAPRRRALADLFRTDEDAARAGADAPAGSDRGGRA